MGNSTPFIVISVIFAVFVAASVLWACFFGRRGSNTRHNHDGMIASHGAHHGGANAAAMAAASAAMVTAMSAAASAC